MTVEEYRQMVREQQTEHQLMLEVTRWLIANLGPNVAWSACDHAAKISQRQGANRKARGVQRGMADYLFIIPPNGTVGQLELKRPVASSRQSPEQRDWQARVTAAGGLYAVCRSLPEVIGTLRAWDLVRQKEAA